MSAPKNKPQDTPFKQQRLPAFQPIYTPKVISIIFFILGAVLYIFGFPIYALSHQIVEFDKRYDDCTPNSSDQCVFTMDIDEKIPEPVFVYYELVDFYQNHRLYVRSTSYTQARDAKATTLELDKCKPAKYNKDFAGYYDPKVKNLDPDDVAIPCGMVARSVFNDTFAIEGYEINEDDIVFDSDKDIWKNGDKSKQWRDIDNHMRVWMKISPFSTFRKLWGVIEKDVEKGTITVTVENNYSVDRWNGEKKLVLSNANAFGGKNPALGIIFIFFGTFSIMCGLIFLVTAIVYKQPDYGDPLSWKY